MMQRLTAVRKGILMKKLTILHSNDMHGDFFPDPKDGMESGGLVRLSGYVQKERRENPNLIYVIAGDMFRGSIIDSEYLGLSTIDLINVMNPDLVTLGNHEVDYGIAHLLFLEKCATFPIINANLFVRMNNARLFRSHMEFEVNDMNILFIGILTEEVIASTKTEKVIGSFIDLEEAARTVGIICDNYRTQDTDLTVLITHIGIERDRELAKLLKDEWGVDLIIGGHSHTFMSEPEYVNGYPIVQAGYGTDQIGRLDLVIDDDKNEIADLKWQCVPINPETAPEDEVMQALIMKYKTETDAKYRRLITHFKRQLTHPSRTQETELGNLYADILQDESSFDIMLMGSGSIRKETLGPVVEMQDLLETTPYDDNLWMVKVTGSQFRRMVQYIMRDQAWEGHTEFYQFSRGVRIVYRKSTHTLEELSFNGKEIQDNDLLKIALQNYHFENFEAFFNVPMAEVVKNGRPVIVASSINNIFEEYLTAHPGLDSHVEGRIVILD